jgi:uncharacterized membrane protein
MQTLLIAAVLWLTLHIGVAGSPLRGVIAARTGERGFRGLFSLASIAVFVLLIRAFLHAPRSALWVAPEGLRWVLVLLMLPAAFLLLASFAAISLNPADAGTRRGPARGILRITRHPMMWSFSLWAAIHIIGTGELSALLFFGTFLVTALAGMPSIDAKFARRDPLRWQQVAAETSILPGGAILAGRNRLIGSEIGWLLPLGALALWAVLLLVHQKVFGIAPVALPW